MRVKKTIKKIASIGAAATMVGATLMGAAMAADLSEYPDLFIEDGSFNGILVVGADAKAEDVIGITNIATSLQTVSVQTTAVADEEVTEEYSVSEGYELCNRNLYVNISINSCEPSVDDADLDLLADDVYHDAEGDNDNDEKYTQVIFFQNAGTGQFLYTQDDDDAPVANTYLFIDNGNTALYNYSLQFDSYVEVTNTSNAAAGDDLEGTTVNIQGRSYTITDATLNTGVLADTLLKLELQSGDTVVWMSEGESLTRTIDGVEHTVELMDVSADADEDSGSCGFKVDGTEVWVDVKDTETVNGVTVGVTDAKRVNIEAGDQDVCETVIGAGEVTIRAADEIQFNNEDVDGTLGLFRSPATKTSGGNLRWSGFDITFAPDTDEVYLAPGDEYIDPMFGNFKFVFAGVETGGIETIEFVAGSTSGEIRFKNEDGRLVEIPLAADSSFASGEGSIEFIFWGNEAPTSSIANQDELVYLEGEVCTGSASVVDCQGAMFLVVEATKLEAHLIQITNIDTVDNEINFDDLTYGTTDDDVAYLDQGSATGTDNFTNITNITLKSAGAIGLIINETGRYINFTSLSSGSEVGTSNGTNIRTLNRGTLQIKDTGFTPALVQGGAPWVGNQTFMGLQFYEYNDGDLGSTLYLGVGAYGPLNVTAFYDDVTDNSIEFNSTVFSDLGSVEGKGPFDESDENDDFQKFYTNKGTLITYDREDQQSLVIEHPYDTSYAKIYIAPTEASTAEVSSTTVSTVVPISVSAVKLDTEVSSVTTKNIVAVGGPCANSVVAELMDNPAACETALGVESGQALIKLFENGDYVALVVAGQDAMDTRLAAQILSNWDDYDLSGSEMIATTVSESSLSVEAVE